MYIKKVKNPINKEYTLHDARIQDIEVTENSIILKLDRITSYPQDTAVSHNAHIILDNTDGDDCEVYVFDKLLNPYKNKELSVKCLLLHEFIEVYQPLDFEIIDEIHDGNHLILSGWLYRGDKPVSCMMKFCSAGDFIYDIHEKQ